jgi:hypothetical protein
MTGVLSKLRWGKMLQAALAPLPAEILKTS